MALVTACGGASYASNGQPAKSSAPQTSSAQTSQPAVSSGGGSGSGSSAGSGGGSGGIPQNNGGDHDGDNNGGQATGTATPDGECRFEGKVTVHLRRNWVIVIAGAGVLAVAAVVALIFARGQSGPAQSQPAVSQPAQSQAAPISFAWFRSETAPASWLQASLAGHSGVLSYPSTLRPMSGDAGTVTYGLNTRAGAALIYLNVTPRQGGETLRNWPGFRTEHLREDGETAVRIDATSGTLSFRGGQGRCVVDDYTTKIHNNHYREIACFVQGATGAHTASVLIAATRAVTWAQYGTLLEQVVNGYAVK